MLNRIDKKASIISTLERIVPIVNDRTWIVEYLYRHKIGNKLPRGKRFKLYREVEKKYNWLLHVTNTHSLINFNFAKQVSPLLLSQIALLRKATIYNECQLNTEVVFEVIKWLEGEDNAPPSIKFSKKPGSFSGGSILKSYEHFHAPMLPNSYMKMMKKSQNIKRIANHVCDENNQVDLKKVELDILQSGKKKPGRLTGHLLITKIQNGIRYYLAVFPHDYSYELIHKQLLESEKFLSFND
jgi:hypothetical protein